MAKLEVYNDFIIEGRINGHFVEMQGIFEVLLRTACKETKHFATDILSIIQKIQKEIQQDTLENVYWFAFHENGVVDYAHIKHASTIKKYSCPYVLEFTPHEHFAQVTTAKLYKARIVKG